MIVKEGNKAPSFKLEGNDGKVHTLSEFSGKPLVLYFYPKDNTPGCTIEAKGFNKKLEDIRASGAEVVGISKDTISSHDKFAAKYKLKFLLLSDPDSNVIKAYGAYGDRGIFGKGTLRKTFIIGADGKIKKIFEKVNPMGHEEEVINAIKSIV